MPNLELIETKLTLTTIAETRVSAIITKTRIVATTRVEENIFLIWLNGPIRKHVLNIKIILIYKHMSEADFPNRACTKIYIPGN